MNAALPTIDIPSAQALYHISRTAYAGAGLYFGCNDNRYDDPHGRFGVLYLGFDLATCLMESMFHDHLWSGAPRLVQQDAVDTSLVREIAVLECLTLLNLNAPGAMAGHFGLNLQQLVSRDYAHTQALAALAHAQSGVDGIVYPSRNNFPGNCVALFDRCQDKLGVIADIPLAHHRRWPGFVDEYAIQIRQLDR